MNALGEMVINYFKMGVYTAADLPLFVAVGWITQAQSDKLTAPEQPANPSNDESPSEQPTSPAN